MSRILTRLQARLQPETRGRLAIANGRITADATGLDPLIAEAITVALAEDPLGEEQVVEIADRGQDIAGLTEALQARGLPVRGVSKFGGAPGLLFVQCGRDTEDGPEDATPAELARIEAACRELVAPPRPREAVKGDIRRVLAALAEMSAEPEVFAVELAGLEVERDVLLAQL